MDESLPKMPRTRGECEPGAPGYVRPCPHTACRHHIASAEESCALDVAGDGPATAQRVGDLLGIKRQWVDYVEERALVKLRKRAERFEMSLDMIVELEPHPLVRIEED